jgi:hypothetical protein
VETRGDYFLFGLFFIKKKVIKPIFFKKKPKPVQTDRFRFGFLGQKSVQTGLARFFWFGSFFSGLGSVRFFQFQAYKSETEPVGFFKILICFFSRFGFFKFISQFF